MRSRCASQRPPTSATGSRGCCRLTWLFINPDLTVHLLRPPAGEWLCLAARTLPSDTGVGIAESALYDERGRVGRSVQSLLLDDSR